MFRSPIAAWIVLSAGLLGGQEPARNDEPVPALESPAPASAGDYVVPAGTKVPLSLINSISTKHSAEGDRVYLETAFPVLTNGRIVIPVGSYVVGTVTQVKRPGKVKGRGELYIRFDALTLPNGVTRDFHARIGGMDGTTSGELDRAEGTVKSDGNKAGDVRTVGETAGVGASVGSIAGSAAGRPGMGIGVGAGAGAAAGLMAVLLTRGPDAVLAKGSTVEMVLDRNLSFSESDLNFGGYQPPRTMPASAAAGSDIKSNPVGFSGRRFPY
jgi:type IV secretion system protein VirB10